MNVEELTSLNTTDKEALANLGLRDLYFFTRGILRYNKLVPHVHRDPCAFFSKEVSDGASQRRGHLAPRDHFKTTLGIGDCTRRICKRPDIRILIVNELLENARLILGGIKRHFESNEWFRILYPHVIPQRFRDTVWSADSILVPRDAAWTEPTVTAVGTGTMIESRHFNLLNLDDIIGRAHMESPTLMKEAISWLKYSISLLVEPLVDEIHIRGTRWAHDDAYAFAMEKMKFEFLIQKAIVKGPDGNPEPLFPELISLQMLQDIIETDPEQYARNYANDPFDSDQQAFRSEWLKYYTVGPDRAIRYRDERGLLHRVDLDRCTIYSHVDPALGDDRKNDPPAFVTVAIAPGPKVFVLEAFKKRITPVQQVSKMIQIQETFAPDAISVESVGYQKALKYFADKESRRVGVYLNVLDYKPERGKSKHQRIRARLQPLFRTGAIFIRSEMIDLIEEYLKFGHTEEDHLMDALAQGPEFWREPWNDHQLRRHNRMMQEMEQPRGLTGYGC